MAITISVSMLDIGFRESLHSNRCCASRGQQYVSTISIADVRFAIVGGPIANPLGQFGTCQFGLILQAFAFHRTKGTLADFNVNLCQLRPGCLSLMSACHREVNRCDDAVRVRSGRRRTLRITEWRVA